MTDMTHGHGMTCDEALETAALVVAGEADDSRRAPLEEHLDGCAACRAEVGLMRRALDLLRAGETPDPGAEYWRTFDSRLRVRILRERAARRWRSVASLAAAALVVAGLCVWTAVHHGASGPADHAALAPAGPESGDAGPGPVDTVPGDEAEARLDEVIEGLAVEAHGERSFEAVLDEVTPAAPPGLEGDFERSDLDPAQAPDNC